MKKDEVKSLFTLAGIPVLGMWELMNQYWPRPEIEDTPEGARAMLRYGPLLIGSPWWLVKTPVTKDETMVHADSMNDALRYLSVLNSWGN